MEISSLRSLLQHTCNDLQNLTNADLQEGKWLTKRNVLQNIISSSPSLSNENDELVDLTEERNRESSIQKKGGSSREVRIEAETEYRTKFMRIVLGGLTRLRWPPSLEAFSDPMDALLHDNSSFLNALEFLLRVAIPASNLNHRDLRVSTRTDKTSPSGKTPRPLSGRKESNADPPSRPQLAVSRNAFDDSSISFISAGSSGGGDSSDYADDDNADAFAAIHANIISSREPAQRSVGKSTGSRKAGGSSGSGGMVPGSGEIFVEYLNNKNTSPKDNRQQQQQQQQPSSLSVYSSHRSHHLAVGIDDDSLSLNSSRLNYSASAIAGDDAAGAAAAAGYRTHQELNWRAFEVLQRQNEALSVRLRELQLSVLRRDEAEARIAGILSELKSTVADIAEAGNVGSNRRGGGSSSMSNKHDHVEEDDGAFIRRPAAIDRAGGTEEAGSSSVRKAPEVHSATAASATRTTGGGAGSSNTRKSLTAVDKGKEKKEKEEELRRFRQEVQREEEEALGRKDSTLGISSLLASPSSAAAAAVSSTPHCSNCARNTSSASSSSSSSSTVLWSKLLGKVQGLETQWSAAQRAARSLAESVVAGTQHQRKQPSQHNRSPTSLKGSPPLHFKSGGGGSSEGTLYSARSTASRGLVSHALGVQPALISAGSIYSIAPLAGHDEEAQEGDVQGLGLDLSRLHLIQRDLAAFAEHALAWTREFVQGGAEDEEEEEQVDYNESNESRRAASAKVASTAKQGSNPPRRPPSQSQSQQQQKQKQQPQLYTTSERAARTQQTGHALQLAAWELLLHLSCLAPIAPLALRSPFRSCLSGLDALVQEVSRLFNISVCCCRFDV